VFLLVGLSVAAVLVLRAIDAPARAQNAAVLLLVVEVAQGAVGFAQYFTGLPVALVTLHLLGAAVLAAAMTWLLLSVRQRV
jgi:heme a synthase